MLLFAAAALPVILGASPEPANCVNAPAPTVNLRPNVARATSSPWVDSNAWRFLRDPQANYCIEAPIMSAALAAAEAYAYGVRAFLKTTADGPAADMIRFLNALPRTDNTPLANIGIVDDGSPQTGEMMNLLSRRNLLYKVVKEPDPTLAVNLAQIQPGDPGKQAYAVRQELGDDKRLLRIYGSEVVIGRLTGSAGNVRVHLVNYSHRAVNGLRVRVLGNYSAVSGHIYGAVDAKLAEVTSAPDATEFTIGVLNEYAVIDLGK